MSNPLPPLTIKLVRDAVGLPTVEVVRNPLDMRWRVHVMRDTDVLIEMGPFDTAEEAQACGDGWCDAWRKENLA